MKIICFDNGGTTHIRYSAVYVMPDGRRLCRSMSFDCDKLNGVNCIEEIPATMADLTHLGVEIDVDELPEGPREQVVMDVETLQ